MIWLTWRQHRIEGFVLLGALVLSSLFLLLTGLSMTQDFQHSGVSACLGHDQPQRAERHLRSALSPRFGTSIARSSCSLSF